MDLGGWNDSIAGKVFALHVANPSSIPSSPHGLSSTTRCGPKIKKQNGGVGILGASSFRTLHSLTHPPYHSAFLRGQAGPHSFCASELPEHSLAFAHARLGAQTPPLSSRCSASGPLTPILVLTPPLGMGTIQAGSPPMGPLDLSFNSTTSESQGPNSAA